MDRKIWQSSTDGGNQQVLKITINLPIGSYHAYAFCFAENQVGVLFKDITEQRKTEEALKESEERFRIALKNAPVSVAAQDCDLRYIWAYNQRTARPDQIIGKLYSDIFTTRSKAS